MAAVRLDKYLAQSGERTRSEAVRAVKAGQVRVNGTVVRDPSAKVQDTDTITLMGETIGDGLVRFLQKASRLWKDRHIRCRKNTDS